VGTLHHSKIDVETVVSFLNDHLGSKVTAVHFLDEGAWSRCFAFQRNGEDLVIRLGAYVDDFYNDHLAHSFAGPDLPIPNVLEIGENLGGHYAISERVFGVPLESVGSDEWTRLVPAIVSLMEAMRLSDMSQTKGFGGWGTDQAGSCDSWTDHLLSVDQESPEMRTFGWKDQLYSSREGRDAFQWGLRLLRQVASDEIPRTLLHCDLINRNVLVDQDRISGVFDWGCSRYGDHLYELAWFEFWSPWFPHLDVGLLRLELERHWHKIGYVQENVAERLLACYLHIGLDHLVYNSYKRDVKNLLGTITRLREIAS
jgi:hygromycin-B 4-O-kinase